MKTILALTTVFAVLSCSTSQAASLRIDNDPAGSNVFSIYLNGEDDNGLFDTIIVDISPDAGSSFGNLDPVGFDGSTPRPPGDEFTYINPFLAAPPVFGGNGFTLLGVSVTANGVQFSGGPFGGTIDTVNGPNVGPDGLFLANVFLVGEAGTANVKMVRAGTIIRDLSEPFGVPEPTSLLLAGLGMLGSAGRRRRQ